MLKFFKQRRLEKLEIKLAGVLAEHEEAARITRITGTYYPIKVSCLVQNIAEYNKEIEILKNKPDSNK